MRSVFPAVYFFFKTGLRPVPFINRNKDLSLRLYIVVAYSCLVLFSNLLTRIYGTVFEFTITYMHMSDEKYKLSHSRFSV